VKLEPQEDITQLLRRFQDGDSVAQSRLINAVHGELRSMAARYMRRERQGLTLQTTALLNEAYVKLVNVRSTNWQDRAHFFAVAARIMRQILVDHARKRLAGKHGGGAQVLQLDEALVFTPGKSAELVALDGALTRLGENDERASRIVELRFFGGLSVDETAEVLKLSRRAVEREWTFARAWLRDELGMESGHA
jgi:RNA polymerase sigma factor (TIGR02999 family)